MIVSVDEVKEILRPDIEETTDLDVLLEKLIKRKQAVMERYIGYPIEAADYTEKYDGNGENFLFLRKIPVNSVSQLKIDTSVINSAYYKVLGEEGILYCSLRFTKGVRNIEVQFNAGYEIVPEDLKDACIQLVCAEYVFTQIMVAGVESKENKIEKKRELEKDAYRILDLYRLPNV